MCDDGTGFELSNLVQNGHYGIAGMRERAALAGGLLEVKTSKEIEDMVREFFPLKPADIIKQLNLKRPIYQKTAAYGHFGRTEPEFSWEQTHQADLIREKAGL